MKWVEIQDLFQESQQLRNNENVEVYHARDGSPCEPFVGKTLRFLEESSKRQ